MFVPFHGVILAPLYIVLFLVKSTILIILNPKLEEVRLCQLEQCLQETDAPNRSLVTTNAVSFRHI